MDATRLLAPAGAPGQAHQYQQQGQQQPAPAPLQQQQQQGQQPAPAPNGTINIAPAVQAPGSGTEGYDLSSLEQLQAHALQLSASAGLTNMLLPNSNGQQGQQNQQQTKHQPFIFLQPANGNQGFQSLAALGAAAPATEGASNNSTGGNSNAPAPGQNFLLGNQGKSGTMPAPANLGQQLFAAASGGPASLNLAPNGNPQQQSYSSSGIPIPMPMIIPQQQQGQQQQLQPQPQLQPLQPAPAAVAGTKRVHDASVVSSSDGATNSSNSNNNLLGMSSNSSSMNMNMNDFPEFQLRNKDGSIITEKDLEKMSPAERRRYERNLREQQRSFRISQQIQQLRDVLAESKVPFKPNKYSILVSVADYIKQLQTRAIMLDSEHKKLFKTIQETNEMVASGQIPADANTPQQNGNVTNDQGDMLIVEGLDYQAVFEQTPTANGVASIDGRILACNKELENILECTREQIERQSLFTLVQNHQEIFEAMAELLKRADALSNGSLKADPVQLLYWSGRVVTPDDKKLGMNITLACTKEGSPKFFSFCMSPA